MVLRRNCPFPLPPAAGRRSRRGMRGGRTASSAAAVIARREPLNRPPATFSPFGHGEKGKQGGVCERLPNSSS
jgi:hypothetical protein